MPVYIEEKVRVSFLWHPDTLFQLNDISVGTSCLVENTVKHIHFQDHRQEINAYYHV